MDHHHDEPQQPQPQQPPQQQQEQLLLEQHIDPTMELSLDELRWAHQIKKAIISHNHNNNNNSRVPADHVIRMICDMECAQWAIVTLESNYNNNINNKLDQVLERIYKLQCFRDQYRLLYIDANSHNVDDDDADDYDVASSSTSSSSTTRMIAAILHEGIELMRDYIMDQQPGNILAIDYWDRWGGSYIMVFDYAAKNPSAVNMPQDWKIFSGATYYMFLAMTSNLQATRQGVVIIAECSGMGFQNVNLIVEERWMTELFNYFPIRHKEFMFLHPPTVARLVYSSMKPLLSEEMKRSIYIYETFDGYDGRIDRLFLTPTPQVASQRLLEQLEQFLAQRLHHQASYRLPPEPPAAATAAVAS